MKNITKELHINGSTFNCNNPGVMGILNVTPDSFYSGSRGQSEAAINKAAEKMVKEGVDIIDLGAYSSRPGAEDVSQEEEIRRISVALKTIRNKYPDILLSLDTFRYDVAKFGIEQFGVNIINDISGGGEDERMFELLSKKSIPYILMHMQGNPKNMQLNPSYNKVVEDILEWFKVKIARLVEQGVTDIVIDPGFGFGKTVEQNYQILSELERFTEIGFPVMAGLSRKSMIWKRLDITPEKSLNATTALNMIALKNGASIIRVHDVKEAVESVKLHQSLKL